MYDGPGDVSQRLKMDTNTTDALAFVEVHEGIAAGYRNLVVFAGRVRAITPPLEW